MTAADFMTSPIVFTQPHIKVAQLKDMFNRKSINAVPVVAEGGDIVGIVSSSDLVQTHDESMTAADIMSSKVHVCPLNMRIKDVAKSLLKHHVHHLVVMEDGKITGMISSLDVIEALLAEDAHLKTNQL